MGETTRRGLFYSRTYKCLFCEASFEGYRMYPMARDKNERWDGYFDFPYYEHSDASGQFSNYLLIEVKVCPGCAFASNDDIHFQTDRTTGEPWTPEESEREAIVAQGETRQRIAAEAADLQAFPRTVPDALIACKLAMHSSTILLTSGRRNPMEAARLGNYALKSAHLSGLAGETDKINLWRKAALEYLTRAFGLDIRGVTLYRTIYQLGALGIFFGDDRAASRAFDYLRQLSDKEPARDASRYLERLRKIWQDRDLHRLKA